MANDFLYALPLPQSTQPLHPARRKRKQVKSKEEAEQHEDDTIENIEYTAVITPEERVQRRLAGHAVHQVPPLFPFPHAPASEQHSIYEDQDLGDIDASTGPNSLRLQHLAAMTALLHRCLESRDYKRASRALALILRTEIHGRTIDIRNAGLWGVGAEILFRLPSDGSAGYIAREGFGRAKLFYDRMALQHPWHRSWPNVTNAQDFKLAMFGLWIYVTSQESRRLRKRPVAQEREPSTDDLDATKWELSETERIAQEMDSLMNTIPYVDDLELIRLRGMVALWMADLIDAIEAEADSNPSTQEQAMEKAWLGQDNVSEEEQPQHTNAKATAARSIARTMFAKIKDKTNDDASVEDDHGN